MYRSGNMLPFLVLKAVAVMIKHRMLSQIPGLIDLFCWSLAVLFL